MDRRGKLSDFNIDYWFFYIDFLYESRSGRGYFRFIIVLYFLDFLRFNINFNVLFNFSYL